jgi:hypothetical protein
MLPLSIRGYRWYQRLDIRILAQKMDYPGCTNEFFGIGTRRMERSKAIAKHWD